MAYLTERLLKLEKKHKKSKKHDKKRSCDLSDSDSNSDKDSGSGSTESLIDKQLKLEQPHLESTDPVQLKLLS